MRRRDFLASVAVGLGAIRFPWSLLDAEYREDIRTNDSTVMEVIIHGSMGERICVVEFERFGTDARSKPFDVGDITDEVTFEWIDCPDLGVRWDLPNAPRLDPGDTMEIELRINNSSRWDFARLAGRNA